MKTSSRPNFHVILIHYPVVGKNGDTIASAVTNLDLHDIARAGRTYGIRSFYIVTPVRDQLELVDKIVSHWVSGAGAVYNPKRRRTLQQKTMGIQKQLSPVRENGPTACR